MNMYQVVEADGLWTVGFRVPVSGAQGPTMWETDSDHGSKAEAQRRAHWLNGTFRRGLVYRSTEPGLWTVGHFNRHGEWCPDETFNSRQAAARSVAQGNGTKTWETPEWHGPVTIIVEES